MAIITIKEQEINTITVKDSFHRRAVQFRNTIIKTLGRIGVKEDDVDVSMELVANKSAPASVSWYFDDYHLYFSYSMCTKFVENLYVVQKLLELEVDALVSGEKTPEQFVADFREEKDVAEQRLNARELLGVSPDEKDMAVINKAFKDLAKEHHPDKEGGDTAKFKEINHAHKMLKRELQ